MARLRYNGLTATLGADLTSSATAITFAAPLTHSGGIAVPTITGSDYIPLTILDAAGSVSEIVSLTAYTSGAATGTITRAQESTTATAHASGDAVLHAPTVVDFASTSGTTLGRTKAKRAAGNVTLNSTTFVNIDTGLDLTIPAAAGDVLEVTLACRASAGSGTYCVLDFHTIVSGAPVNSVGADAAAGTSNVGFPTWSTGTMRSSGSGYTHFSGAKQYTVQAGDISGGNVILRLRGFSGAAVTLDAVDPFLYVAVVNLGQ